MNCKKCGALLSENLKNCKNCGSKNPNYTYFYLGQTPIKVSKFSFLSLIVLGVLFWVAIMSSFINSPSTENNIPQKHYFSKNEVFTRDLGSYSVGVLSVRYSNTIDGKKAVIITYSFTNNSTNDVSFNQVIKDAVYQNGVECDILFFSNDNSYKFEMDDKNIKPGVTIAVEKAYELNDNSSELQVELSKLFSVSRKKHEITIPLNEIVQ